MLRQCLVLMVNWLFKNIKLTRILTSALHGKPIANKLLKSLVI